MIVLVATGTARATFTIGITVEGGITRNFEETIFNAKSTWESVINGYKPGVSLNKVFIHIGTPSIDGFGGVLAEAGPFSTVEQQGTVYTDVGFVNVDAGDVVHLNDGDQTYLNDLLLHEMGHALGIGTLWQQNGLYVAGSGRYTGAAGLAAYTDEFSQTGSSVPVEIGGRSGANDFHWNEVDGGGEDVGITSRFTHRDFQYELMTAWLDSPAYMSNLTKASLIDLGYDVNVPEPTGLLLAGIGLVTLGLVARRKKYCRA